MDNTPITQAEIVDSWARILILRWQRQLIKRKIGKSGSLQSSFKYEVQRSGSGEVQRIDLSFDQSGRFVDMGVGKGTPIGLVKENARAINRLRGVRRRRPSKWYSPTLTAETRALAELLSKHYATNGLNIIENLHERIQIDF